MRISRSDLGAVALTLLSGLVWLGLPIGAADATVALPPVGAAWDYQIGGAFAPAAGVAVVDRDRRAQPAPGRYNICYVNAFQTQPGEAAFWRQGHHRNLLLRRADGAVVVDAGWGEDLLDTRTAAKRRALSRIVGRWLDGCARSGFDAVELDNLDSWSRSGGLISRADDRRFARMLIGRAHADGLAAAQKNWAELGVRGPALGFDLAVAEECGRWAECGSYMRAYGGRVLDVEYRRRDFRRACASWAGRISVVLRDRDVTPGGVDRRC